MRDLANQVGMEAASLYNHIRSKQQILNDICFSLANTYTEKMNKVYPGDLSPIDKIKSLVSLHIQVHAMSSPIAAVMNDEWRYLTEPNKTEFVAMRDVYDQRFIDIIQKGIDEGDIKKLNPRIAYFTLLSSIRWLQHWFHANSEFDVDDIKRTITEMILTGIVVIK